MPQNQTLKVSYAYINWLLANDRAVVCHLYKFVSLSGQVDYFTDLDANVFWSNIVWKSGVLLIEGLSRKLSIGTSTDSQSVKIWAGPEATLWGGNFLTGCEEGSLDGAMITRYRLVWPLVSGVAAVDISLNPVAAFVLFTGYIGEIEKGGSGLVQVKVKSPLMRLDVNMPRNYWQPGCNWTLFDPGCTLIQSSFVVNGTITFGQSQTRLPIVGGLTDLGADGIAQYAQGRILFTSGVNAGLLSLIADNDAVVLELMFPLDTAPAVGDTVQFWPGCSKSFNTCKLKFANDANFRGFDKVPPVMISF